MYSENGVLVDFDEISKVITNADVFGIAFGHFPERLIVDTRSNDNETPLITVSQPKGSAQQRIAWLKRRRPSLGAARAFSLVSWPHSPRFLEDSGVWDDIRRRVGAEYDSTVEVQCSLALKQLQDIDRETVMGLIKGEDALTLWPPESHEDED